MAEGAVRSELRFARLCRFGISGKWIHFLSMGTRRTDQQEEEQADDSAKSKSARGFAARPEEVPAIRSLAFHRSAPWESFSPGSLEANDSTRKLTDLKLEQGNDPSMLGCSKKPAPVHEHEFSPRSPLVPVTDTLRQG